MYISGNGFKPNLGRYTNSRLGGYSGLGSMWGEAKETPEGAIAKIKAAAKGGPKANAIKPVEKELSPKDTVDISRQAEYFISKTKPVLNSFEAENYLKAPYGSQVNSPNHIKGKVYWTPEGPKFTQKKNYQGRTAETVGPPDIKLKPNIKIVRDLPTIPNLEPIKMPPAPKSGALQGFFGEATKSKWPLIIVLGLLFLLLRSYNRS